MAGTWATGVLVHVTEDQQDLNGVIEIREIRHINLS